MKQQQQQKNLKGLEVVNCFCGNFLNKLWILTFILFIWRQSRITMDKIYLQLKAVQGAYALLLVLIESLKVCFSFELCPRASCSLSGFKRWQPVT